MVLPVPYPVYGYIISTSGASLSGANVSATDITNPQGTGNDTSDANGSYSINLMDYADDGDTIQVTATSGVNTDTETFTLNLSDGAYRLDLTPSSMCDTFTITGTTDSITLLQPYSLQLSDSRGIKQIHFFTGADTVFDIGKETESLTISGMETSNVSSLFSTLDGIISNGEEVTISDMGINDIDTTWYISDYNYTVVGGMEDECEYNITLEKS